MACRMIDMQRYPRREHFDYFRSLPYPYVGVTAEVDVSALAGFCKAQGCSFYLSFLHAAALAADEVAPLRQRIRGGGIVEYSECPTSHIELKEDGTYCYCTLRHHLSWDAYLRSAAEERKKCREKGTIQEDGDVESMYFISALPWLHYSSLIQPVAGGDESNPRITWGKFQWDGAGKCAMPLSILAHHALVDGVHLAQFYEKVQEKMAAICQGR